MKKAILLGKEEYNKYILTDKPEQLVYETYDIDYNEGTLSIDGGARLVIVKDDPENKACYMPAYISGEDDMYYVKKRIEYRKSFN